MNHEGDVEFEGRSWTHIGTGGGCTAWHSTLEDGGFLLSTALGGASAPEPGETAEIGRYDADGEPIDETTGERVLPGELRLREVQWTPVPRRPSAVQRP